MPWCTFMYERVPEKSPIQINWNFSCGNCRKWSNGAFPSFHTYFLDSPCRETMRNELWCKIHTFVSTLVINAFARSNTFSFLLLLLLVGGSLMNATLKTIFFFQNEGFPCQYILLSLYIGYDIWKNCKDVSFLFKLSEHRAIEPHSCFSVELN